MRAYYHDHTLNRGRGRPMQARRRGVLPRLSDGRFHGERPLSGAQLADALTIITGEVAASVRRPALRHRLRRSARAALSSTTSPRTSNAPRGAGLNPPRYFGTEVVARFLGLRTNHPFADDALELYPWRPITRAEAAHSLQTLIDAGLGGEHAREQLLTFSLPRYGARTKRALRVAVSKIGMPYIWGGETDRSLALRLPGARRLRLLRLRVARFKLSGQAAGKRIGGRTAAQMAGEIRKSAAPPARRDPPRRPGLLRPRQLQRSKATETGVDHVGIALSEHWMIHSSARACTSPRSTNDWRQDRFTWARRVL